MTAEEITALYEDFKARLSKEYYLMPKSSVEEYKDWEKATNLIICEVAINYGLTPTQIKSGSRKGAIPEAKHVSIYIIKQLLPEAPLSYIAGVLGLKTHSSCIHSIKYVKDKIDIDLDTKSMVSKIIGKVRGNKTGGVKMYNLINENGVIVKEFFKQIDIANHLGCSPKSVNNVIIKKRGTVYGYRITVS